MQQVYKSISILLFLVIFSSCGTSKKIDTLKPEADLAAPLVYDKEVSQLNIPVSIKLKDIASQINKNLVGLIYEDKNMEEDNILLKVWKESPIELTEESGKVKIVLPLKVWSKVRYGTNVMGMDLYDTRELYLNGIVSLQSDIALNNWQLTSKTTIKSVDWKENPTVKIGGKDISITFLVNPALKYFKTTIEKSIDDALRGSLNFQPYVLDALEKISSPLLVNQQYETWFKITPISLHVTEAKLKNEAISFDMGMMSTMETLIGKNQSNTFRKDKISLKQVSKITDHFTASLMVVSPYLHASQLITKNFEGQEFASGSKKVRVQQVALWHKDGKMIIALGLSGSINGTIYLTGVPSYDEEKSEVYFDQLDYVLDTKNALMKTANWLAQGVILKKIKEHTRYSIKSDIEKAKQQMEQYVKNYSPAQGVYINGKIDGIRFQKMQLTDQAIIATIQTSGKINVTIDGLK